MATYPNLPKKDEFPLPYNGDPLSYYPHRLTMLYKYSICDICEDRVHERQVSITRLSGWLLCNECSIHSDALLKAWVIPKEELVEKFGNSLTVRRTNGEIDEGWAITSQGCWNLKYNEFIFQIEHPEKQLIKSIRMSDVIMKN